MAQRSIPVRDGETAVTAALRVVADLIPAAVTSSYRPGGGSYHGAGQAVDLAALSGPSWDSPELLEINKRVLTLIPVSLIRELIYGGHGGVCVKNGKVLSASEARRIYGPDVLQDHKDHVHLAVVDGFTFNSPEVPMPDDPNIPNAYAPIVAAFPTPTGKGYTIITADGAVFAFGDAEYHGRVEVKK